MATLHHALTMADAEQTACNMSVGYVLAELEEDVTENVEALRGNPDACKACLDALHSREKEESTSEG